MINIDGMYTTREAAERMGVGQEYVRLLARQGKIESVKRGSLFFVRIPASRINPKVAGPAA